MKIKAGANVGFAIGKKLRKNFMLFIFNISIKRFDVKYLSAFQREKSKRKVKCLQIYNDRNIGYNVEVKRKKKKRRQNNADSQAENDRVENNSINLLCLTTRHGNKENVSRV